MITRNTSYSLPIYDINKIFRPASENEAIAILDDFDRAFIADQPDEIHQIPHQATQTTQTRSLRILHLRIDRSGWWVF